MSPTPAETGGDKELRRSVVERARVSVGRLQQRADAARHSHTSVNVAFVVSDQDRRTGGGLLAAACAFRLFLWMLPASLVVTGGLGFVGPSSAATAAESAGLGDGTTDAILQVNHDAHGTRWLALIAGVVLLYMASTRLAKTFYSATAMAWQMAPPRLPSSPRAAGVTGGGLLLAIGLATLGTILRAGRPALGVAVSIALVVVWGLLWWLVQAILPRPASVHWADLWPGALLFGLGTQGLYLFTTLYLTQKLSSASELYGALGGAATLLLYTYLVARLAIGSAVLNAAYVNEYRSKPSPGGHPSPVEHTPTQ